MSYESERAEAQKDGCSCFWTPEKSWVYYAGAVEPGSQMELNDDCPVHGFQHQSIKSTRPDSMDHELGMLYRLRMRLNDEYSRIHAHTYHPNGRFKSYLRGELAPGLECAIKIVEEEIKLRDWR